MDNNSDPELSAEEVDTPEPEPLLKPKRSRTPAQVESLEKARKAKIAKKAKEREEKDELKREGNQRKKKEEESDCN